MSSINLHDLLHGFPGLEDPVNPHLFDREMYDATDEMRLAFESYGWKSADIEFAIGCLCWFVQGGGVGSWREFVAPQIHIYANGKKQLTAWSEAALFFEKLKTIPGVLESIYDESQMILSAKGVGLANGLIWITPLEGQPNSEAMSMRIGALNLPA